MLDNDYPILEYDDSSKAIINPGGRFNISIPKRCVLCFFGDVLNMLEKEGTLSVIATYPTEEGIKKIYKYMDMDVAVMHPSVGASYGVINMERAISFGATKIFACGGAGVIKEGFPLGYLLVVNKAIRDEGTSYHYIRPSRYIDLDENCVLDIKSVLDEEGFSYEVITTWTTDGFYRETLDRKNKRVREGATAVDMECSAFAAVAKFRNIEFGELMYSGDSLAGPNYDRRNWMGITDVRKKVLELTIKAILKR